MKSNIASLYEELRKAIDEGSESMTHDDALKQIACWQNKEQAQAVEPCKGHNCGSISPKLHSAECFDEHEALAGCQRPFGYFHFVFDSDNGDYWRETDDESEMPLFTHPAPQPAATGERAELIARQRSVQENGANAEMRELAKATVDMLEADALEIERTRKMYEKAHQGRADFRQAFREASKAQQVAVPMTDVEIYVAARDHPRIATLVPHIEVGKFARAIEKHHGIGAKP